MLGTKVGVRDMRVNKRGKFLALRSLHFSGTQYPDTG